MVSKFVTYSGLTLYFGLSTDTMPKDVPNGSKYTTIDTDEEYWYDKENHGWYDADGKFIPDNDEKGDDDAMIVEFSVGESDILTCDKTIAELVEFIEADKQLIAKLVTPIGIVYYAQLVLYLPAITSPPSPTRTSRSRGPSTAIP